MPTESTYCANLRCLLKVKVRVIVLVMFHVRVTVGNKVRVKVDYRDFNPFCK